MKSISMPSPFAQVIIGMCLGMFFGLFFGEDILVIDIIGNAYIRLLQMSVLPYLVASLISSIGRLSAERAARIGKAGGLLILLLWFVGMLTVVMLPMAYPDWQASTFFSTSIIAEGKAFDPLSLYLPANVFSSLANTIVPAVVVFSIIFGVALISVKEKSSLIDVLESATQGLGRITSMVVKVAPIGIFAITAVAFGTLEYEQLNRLQVYLWIYLGAFLILMFWTLPVLLAGTTNIRYAEVLKQCRLPVITAIAVGTLLVVLPLIAEKCKELLVKNNMHNDEVEATIDVLVPTAYSFPSVGTLLGLGFIPFAAWYVGVPLNLTQLPEFAITGLMTAFGSMVVALPFLLDQFHLPADLFQLFLLSNPVTGRLGTGLAAMHAVVMSLMGAYAIQGQLRWRRMLPIVGISLGVTFLLFWGLSFIFTTAIDYKYAGYDDLITIKPVLPQVKVVKVEEPTTLDNEEQNQARIDVIKHRGTLRVGYLPERLPFAFQNKDGEVVGFDMELAHALAKDLGVTLEVSKLTLSKGAEHLIDSLNTGRIDILLGGIGVTPPRVLTYPFTNAYLDGNIALVVKDHMRQEFASLETIRKMPKLKLAMPHNEYFKDILQQKLPNAKIVEVSSFRAFLKGKMDDVDAFVHLAEAASAWTLIYPEYSVVVPKELRVKTPIGFVLPEGQQQFKSKLNEWLDLQSRSNTIDQIYQHWILGKSRQKKKPRWSIKRDVLGWGLKETKQIKEISKK
jgi:Na+/H+-dicarboxylate symporter